MSSTTTNSLATFVKNIDTVIVAPALEDRYAEFTFYVFNPNTGKTDEISAPNFDTIGDMNGPIMPHMHKGPVTKGFDVGPRWPIIKLMFREMVQKDTSERHLIHHQMYDVLIKFNRAIHLGYYASIFRDFMDNNGLKWKNGIEFYGFIVTDIDAEEDAYKTTAITSEGPVENLFDYIMYTDKITESVFRKAVKKGFNGDPVKTNNITIPLERSIVYESAKKKGAKTIYLPCKLSHKKYPTAENKYRAPDQEATPDMQKAANWGITIPILIGAAQGGEMRYYAPSKTVNWVDHPELGFKEVTADRDSNYFIGKAVFNCKKSTHFKVDKTLTGPIIIKYNASFVANVFKLPGQSSIGGGKTVSSGFEEMDLDESEILNMHKAGAAPLRSVADDGMAEAASSGGSKATRSLKIKTKMNEKMSDDEAVE